jgi:hypothetical protein
MTPATWIALLLNAGLPAFTAFTYAQYAWAPDWRDDYGLSLLLLYVAQFPVTLLGGVFAGVSYIEGPGWRRVLIYVVVVAIFGGLTGLAKVVYETDMAAIVGWAIALQVTLLMFVGSQPPLALARIEAVTTDAVHLTVLAAFAGFLAIAVGIAWLDFTGGLHAAHHPIEVTWTDLAWIGALYFALRAWSAAYVFTPAFEVRRQGTFDRPWIDRAVRLGKKSPAAEDD